jgi:predicted metal-binding protein
MMNGTKRNTVVRTKHCLLVCTACASVWKDGKREGKSGGQQFMEDLSKLALDWEFSEHFDIREVECMSACSHSCAVSFAAAGKYTYLFGDLPPNEPESVEAVLECAGQYYAKPDGLLPWSERPQALKKGVLAKIPPL